ncbi:MAG TPA: polysaccharide deacetylase family protein [Phycisphaerae bacterium]|nr:polysaccharide deacetylase family protein [Phycisphaerae bacterium]HPS53321.1 polysaccharide deacetylase family protein [Phycisphaerae bacterium]
MKFFMYSMLVAFFILGGCEMVVPEKSRYAAPEETDGKVVFIPTFDDGPIDQKFVEEGVYPKNQEEMLASLHKTLDTLKKHNTTAVFYAVYVRPEEDAPKWSPKSSEKEMRAAFLSGIKAIADAGHVVAIHACNHDEYHNLFMSAKDAQDDIKRLIFELDRTGVAYYPTWRVPYGGMRTLMDEQLVAKNLSLPVETWLVDSHDWTTNHDSTDFLKAWYKDDAKWTANVKKNLRQDMSVSKFRKERQRDILFHVSDRTSTFLDEFLNYVDAEGRKIYGKKFTFLPIDSPYKGVMLEHYLNNKPAQGKAIPPQL